MTFERTSDRILIAELIKRAWDRPEMLSEGADPDNIWLPDIAQCFVGRQGMESVALFVGFQQSSICLDLHVCLTPECRGADAMTGCREFLQWLRANTPYRKVIGSIPRYNRAMLIVALSAGMDILGINRKSVMRQGKLEDQTIVEKFLL